jgi:hypothetical protein
MSVRLEGDDRLIARINSAAKLRNFRRGVKRATLYLRGEAREYPPSPSGRPQFPTGFNSEKQRKYFFWALRKGEIDVPYRRGQSPNSENLQQRWSVSFRSAGLVGVVGNNASYARLVQGPERQAQYHKRTGWKTTTRILEEERRFVMSILSDALEADLE